MTRLMWAAALMAGIVGAAHAEDPDKVDVDLPIRSGALHAEKPLRSWKAIQEDRIVMQRFDYSCGAAALATLIQYYFRDNTSEADILAGVLTALSAKDITDREENGFSLLDLKNYAVGKGYQAVGVRLKYASLPKLKGPVLIHLERDDYKHFAVLKGVRGDRVFLADPSRGNIRMTIDRFAQEWTGVALVLGKPGFGTPIEHPLALAESAAVQDELLAAYRALVTLR